ncbi:MAG: hypothetical protein LBU96_13125 [Yokenella regensburgei]|nr:hypothetical protein [Yokenella regensburgei]
MHKSLLLIAVLLLSACMGTSNDVKLTPDDEPQQITDTLPVCSNHNDIIICDWGH